MSRRLIFIAALQSCVILVGMFRAKGLALLLGPGEYGVVSTIDQVILTLASLGALSIPFTALKFVAHAHSQSDAAFRRAGAMFVRVLGTLGLLTAGLAALVLLRKPAVFGAELVPYRGILLVGFAGLPATMLGMLFVNILAAAQRPTHAAVLGLVTATSLAAAAICGVLMGGIQGLYIALVLTSSVIVVVVVLWMQRSFGFRLLSKGGSLLRELRRQPHIISYSMYIYLALGTYSLSLLVLRTTVLSRMGAEAAGMLQASLSVALTIGALLAATTNLVLAPLVNRQLPIEQKVRAANDFARWAMILLVLAAVPVVLFPKLVVGILFSRAFAPAASSMFLFVLWQCVYQPGNIYHQLLIGLDDVRFASGTTVAGYGVAAMLFAPLIIRAGLAGAALALLIGMLIRGIAAIWRLSYRWRTGLPGALYLQMAGVVAIVSIGGVAFNDIDESSTLGITLRILYGGMMFVQVWWLLGSSERSTVRGGPAKVLAYLSGRFGEAP